MILCRIRGAVSSSCVPSSASLQLLLPQGRMTFSSSNHERMISSPSQDHSSAFRNPQHGILRRSHHRRPVPGLVSSTPAPLTNLQRRNFFDLSKVRETWLGLAEGRNYVSLGFSTMNPFWNQPTPDPWMSSLLFTTASHFVPRIFFFIFIFLSSRQ